MMSMSKIGLASKPGMDVEPTCDMDVTGIGGFVDVKMLWRCIAVRVNTCFQRGLCGWSVMGGMFEVWSGNLESG